MIKILNRGDVELVAIMDMLEEREAFEAALAAQDCSLALQHAERAYAAGRIWLFGPSWDKEMSLRPLDEGGAERQQRLDVAGAIKKLQAEREREELWQIGKALDDLYSAHHCLGHAAETAGDPRLAYTHFRTGDSLFNLIEREGENETRERARSLQNMARMASDMMEYDVADSLFRRSLECYEEAKDTLDAGGAWILYDWSRSLATRRQWGYSNFLLRWAIGLCEADTTAMRTDEQWIEHRLQLVKNLMVTDSLGHCEAVLAPCLAYIPMDPELRCKVLLVKGSLEYRQNAFKKADGTFDESLNCLLDHEAKGTILQHAYVARGYSKLALAAFPEALRMVDAGEAANTGLRRPFSMLPNLLRLRAEIHHQQGLYSSALSGYETLIEQQRAEGSDQLASSMNGLAEVLLDLAQIERARSLAEEALAQMADTITELTPSQAFVMNTAAYANYLSGELERASERYKHTMELCERYSAKLTATYAQAVNGLALVEMARQRSHRADSLLDQAYRITEAVYGDTHPFIAQVMINQAELRLEQRRFPDAARLLNIAKTVTQRSLGNDHDQLGDIEKLLGDMAKHAGNMEKAALHYAQALRIYSLCFPGSHPKVVAMRARV
ncbi:MAG: tetratricopeptide repeat protein [Flavobacteriales bacterium]|nr:tetratricopeptide repeat protein [Flavobacteriales bacterium]